MSKDEAIKLITQLLPQCERESKFLHVNPQHIISASIVFDAIREFSDPTISKEEFNKIVDDLEL